MQIIISKPYITIFLLLKLIFSIAHFNIKNSKYNIPIKTIYEPIKKCIWSEIGYITINGTKEYIVNILKFVLIFIFLEKIEITIIKITEIGTTTANNLIIKFPFNNTEYGILLLNVKTPNIV